MKSSLAHLSPTVVAFGAAIGLSLSLFLLSGAGLQGGAIPLLPALGGATRSVDLALPSAPTDQGAQTTAVSPISAALPSLAPTFPAPTRQPVVHRAHPIHHAPAHARARGVRPAPTPPAPVAVAAPAPTTPVSAPQPVRAPRGKAKALGHQHHAAGPTAAGTPVHGNGHARGHSPDHHQGLPAGQAKTAPAAPTKGKGGGPPADHGVGNSHQGGKK